jgi:hypothetical protein
MLSPLFLLLKTYLLVLAKPFVFVCVDMPSLLNQIRKGGNAALHLLGTILQQLGRGQGR